MQCSWPEYLTMPIDVIEVAVMVREEEHRAEQQAMSTARSRRR